MVSFIPIDLVYWINLNIDDEIVVSAIPRLGILGKPQIDDERKVSVILLGKPQYL